MSVLFSNDAKTIGILGGGQLATMMIEAAHRMGCKVAVLDPNPSCSASHVLSAKTDTLVIGSFNKESDVLNFVEKCKPSVVTTDIEHINTDALKIVEQRVKMYPRPSTVERIKDKYNQKMVFLSQGLSTASFRAISSLSDLKSVIAEWGGEYPVILKTRCNAYDGRGNFVISSENDLEAAIHALLPPPAKNAPFKIPEDALYVERIVPYAVEVSVMVVKTGASTLAHFPLVESLHVQSILRVVTSPTRLPKNVEEKAIELAKNAVQALSDPKDDAGIFGVEMFVHRDTGEILLNEVAPRPHNSGHYTLAATTVSQFEMHLRAILGLPICNIPLSAKSAVMLNILGSGTSTEQTTLVSQLMQGTFTSSPATPSARGTVYFYNKHPWKEQRKIAHINITGESVIDCFAEMLSWPNVDTMIALPTSSANSTASNSHPLIEWYNRTSEILKTTFKTSEAAISSPQPLSLGQGAMVGVIMGSDSDLPKMKAACEMLEKMDVPFEVSIVSAHRTPDRLVEYAKSAASSGLKVIIAGAGGAAHLPGMVASMTPIPVIGVPILIEPLHGLDSMLSILQMPAGIPVATVAINNSTNAALLAVRILGTAEPKYMQAMLDYQKSLETTVLKKAERLETMGWKQY